jgi:hypothetical protein
VTHKYLSHIAAKAKHEHHDRIRARAVSVKPSNYGVNMRKAFGREIQFLTVDVPGSLYGYLGMLGGILRRRWVLEAQVHKRLNVPAEARHG